MTIQEAYAKIMVIYAKAMNLREITTAGKDYSVIAQVMKPEVMRVEQYYEVMIRLKKEDINLLYTMLSVLVKRLGSSLDNYWEVKKRPIELPNHERPIFPVTMKYFN